MCSKEIGHSSFFPSAVKVYNEKWDMEFYNYLA